MVSPTCRKPLRFYASDQVHSCHQKAMETLGLGSRALRLIPTDAAFRIEPCRPSRRPSPKTAPPGFRPACVIATAGTTNTGAFDDLPALADLCAREGLWFHVDGCIGALHQARPRQPPHGRRHRTRRFPRARSAQMAPRAIRMRLRAGPRPRPPLRHLRAPRRLPRGKAARHRQRRIPLRLRLRDCRAASRRSRSGCRSRNRASPSSAA